MRAVYVFIMMSLMAGCSVLPLSGDAPDSRPGQLHLEAEQLLDQPLIDPLTAFLERYAATHAQAPEFRRIARERDSRCRAIGTRYSRRAPTPETLDALRTGYQRSCPAQVEAFARRVPPAPAPSPAAPAAPSPAPEAPGTSDCYLLYAIRNTQQALPACTRAAEAGDAKARHHLASLLRTDLAVTEARHWARLAAEAGYPPGQLLYAELLQLDRTDQGDEQALQLIEAAAEAGLAAAQYQAGMAWLNGVGTGPDRTKAMRWLERAAGQDEDPQLRGQLKELAALGDRVSTLLVLAATSQYRVLKAAWHNYSSCALAGCILTKVDEAGSLGEALGLAIEQRLPVAYMADGQRIPDDLARGVGHQLVSRAVGLIGNEVAEDQTMADVFAGILHAQRAS